MTDLHPEGARHAVIWLHGLGAGSYTQLTLPTCLRLSY